MYFLPQKKYFFQFHGVFLTLLSNTVRFFSCFIIFVEKEVHIGMQWIRNTTPLFRWKFPYVFYLINQIGRPQYYQASTYGPELLINEGFIIIKTIRCKFCSLNNSIVGRMGFVLYAQVFYFCFVQKMHQLKTSWNCFCVNGMAQVFQKSRMKYVW